jgi:hypothetical protein
LLIAGLFSEVREHAILDLLRIRREPPRARSPECEIANQIDLGVVARIVFVVSERDALLGDLNTLTGCYRLRQGEFVEENRPLIVPASPLSAVFVLLRAKLMERVAEDSIRR